MHADLRPPSQILGREMGNIYSRSELKHLIQIHVENPGDQVRRQCGPCLLHAAE